MIEHVTGEKRAAGFIPALDWRRDEPRGSPVADKTMTVEVTLFLVSSRSES